MIYNVESVIAGLEIPVLRAGEKEIRCVCPAHEERTGNPDSVGDWSINRETGEHWCFSCQFGGGSPVTLIAYVLDVPIWEASRWAREYALADLELIHYTEAGWDKRRARRKARKVQDSEPISDGLLAVFDDVPERMLKVRDLDRDAAELYEVAWSREHLSWVLPMRMPNYELIGYQLRAKGWERNQPENVKKSLTLFGIDKFITERKLIIVESPLDAVRLATVGYYGEHRLEGGGGWATVASFGAAVSEEQMAIVIEYADELMVAMDNDRAGWNAVDYIWSHYRRRLKLSFFNYSGIDKGMDPGDMTDDEIERAVETAKPLPVRAA